MCNASIVNIEFIIKLPGILMNRNSLKKLTIVIHSNLEFEKFIKVRILSAIFL